MVKLFKEGEFRFAIMRDPITKRACRHLTRRLYRVIRGKLSGELIAEEIDSGERYEFESLCGWSVPVVDPGPKLKKRKASSP